jgi:hypothetical protein
MCAERRQCLGSRVAVLVVNTSRDDRELRRRRVEEWSGGRRRRAVMADLEDVDVRDQASREQGSLDGRLRVTGEEGAE